MIYTITDIDDNATHTLVHGTRQEVSKIISIGHPIWDLMKKADCDGEATAMYTVNGEKYTTKVVAKKQWTIEATYIEGGNRIYCDRHYALGQYADQVWDSKEVAEEVADELRDDVGTVVDDLVEYHVVEVY